MEIEDVARERLTTWRTAEEQGELSVSNSVLGQIVIGNQRVSAAVAEELAYRTSRVWRNELQWRGGGGACDNHGRVIHGSSAREPIDDLCDCRLFLTNRHINAEDVAAFLIDNGVKNERCLAGLTVADDQFALATTDGDHRVDRFNAGLERLFHRLAQDDAWCFDLDTLRILSVERPFSINRLPQSIHHATEQRLTDRNFSDTPGSAHFIAFSDCLDLTEDGGANIVFFQVQGDAVDIMREEQQF